jgi:hypothetical protein
MGSLNTHMNAPQDYTPSLTQQSTNVLYGNHYRFDIERLPDLSFFVQAVSMPSVSGATADQVNPFVVIRHPGEMLSYGQFQVTYQVDAQFKSYFSLYYWLKGYGFPHSFDEVIRFREQQKRLMPNIRPNPIDLEKTNATLSVLTPDTGAIVAEILMQDVFPIDLSGLQFLATDTEPPVLTTTATFVCTTFDVRLT